MTKKAEQETVRVTESAVTPDQFVLAVVAQAMRKRHRVTQCPGCMGPRIHSKQRRGSRCCGCGQRWEEVVAFPLCEYCHQPFAKTTRSPFCPTCRPVAAKRRKRSLERKAYRSGKLSPKRPDPCLTLRGVIL